MHSKPVKRIIKNKIYTYLAFPRSDRNAIMILLILIFFAIVVNVILRNIDSPSVEITPEMKTIIEEWEMAETDHLPEPKKILFKFDPNTITGPSLDSLFLPGYVKENLVKYRQAGGKFKLKTDLRKIYGMNDSIYGRIEAFIILKPFSISETSNNNLNPVKKRKVISGTFDPNSADSLQLLSFGFHPSLINNLIRYRNAGGCFRNTLDLLDVYGIDSLFLTKVIDNVKLEDDYLYHMDDKSVDLMLVDLNRADTSELIRLPGIGPVFARRIIAYRNLLGGYYEKSQLLEVYNFPEETYYELKDRIKIDSTAIVQLRLNFAGFAELLRHPYMEVRHVKAILNERKKNGMYKSVEGIKEVEGFDPELFERIRPYLTCR